MTALQKKVSSSKLRKFNHLLSVIVVIVSLYIALAPMFPSVGFWWRYRIAEKPSLVAANSGNANYGLSREDTPAENMLVIPRLVMQQEIFSGATADTLNKGVWHRPNTSTPDAGSNTVFVGHRFTYDAPAVFYSLDKIEMGDRLVVYWERQKYVYEVNRIFVVDPTAIEIEAPTVDPMLTIYTCTPLWTAKNRLVIQAMPVEQI